MIICIAVIVVFVVDYSGVVENVKKMLWRWVKGNKVYIPFSVKPFDCSLCLTFWIGLIYLLVMGISLMGLMELVLCCVCTGFIYDVMIVIRTGLKWITDKVMDIITK